VSEAVHHRLEGLEPDNLLAFLALVGLLRALDAARPDWRARVFWDDSRLPLRPVLVVPDATGDAVAEAAAGGAATLAQPHDFDRKDLKFTVEEARKEHEDAKDALREALLDALFSDAAAKEDKQDRQLWQIWPTPFCFLFGQGHQHFLERLADIPKGKLPKPLAKLKRRPDLNAPRLIAEALFAPWTRSDATDSFRWDPVEDRRYALRALDPSGDPGGAQHGANRLAAIGFPVLSGTAILRRNEMRFLNRCVTYGDGGRIALSWPVWTRPARLAGVRALLAHPELCEPEPDLAALARFGVALVFRAERLSVGKFFNVSAARRVG